MCMERQRETALQIIIDCPLFPLDNYCQILNGDYKCYSSLTLCHVFTINLLLLDNKKTFSTVCNKEL